MLAVIWTSFQAWESERKYFLLRIGSYYRSAHGIIIVFDVTCQVSHFSIVLLNVDDDYQESYDHVDTWLEEIKKYGHDDLKKLLVGNKGDSIKERVIHQEVAQVSCLWTRWSDVILKIIHFFLGISRSFEDTFHRNICENIWQCWSDLPENSSRYYSKSILARQWQANHSSWLWAASDTYFQQLMLTLNSAG